MHNSSWKSTAAQPAPASRAEQKPRKVTMLNTGQMQSYRSLLNMEDQPGRAAMRDAKFSHTFSGGGGGGSGSGVGAGPHRAVGAPNRIPTPRDRPDSEEDAPRTSPRGDAGSGFSRTPSDSSLRPPGRGPRAQPAAVTFSRSVADMSAAADAAAADSERARARSLLSGKNRFAALADRTHQDPAVRSRLVRQAQARQAMVGQAGPSASHRMLISGSGRTPRPPHRED